MNLKAGQVFIDVGCHIGDMTLKMVSYLPPNTKIIAIDPSREKLDFLRRTLKSVGFEDRVEFHCCGVSDVGGGSGRSRNRHHIKYVNEPWYDGATDIQLIVAGAKEKGTFIIRTLDDIIGDREVGFVHLDVEGFETRAILGMTNVIKRCKPPMMVEFAHGNDIKKGKAFLEENGYLMQWTGEENTLYN